MPFLDICLFFYIRLVIKKIGTSQSCTVKRRRLVNKQKSEKEEQKSEKEEQN